MLIGRVVGLAQVEVEIDRIERHDSGELARTGGTGTAGDQAAEGARMPRRDELLLQLPDVVDRHLLGQGEVERPGGEDLVFLEQCTAHRVAARVALLQAFEAAGADVLYAPGLPDESALRLACSSVASR